MQSRKPGVAARLSLQSDMHLEGKPCAAPSQERIRDPHTTTTLRRNRPQDTLELFQELRAVRVRVQAHVAQRGVPACPVRWGP